MAGTTCVEKITSVLKTIIDLDENQMPVLFHCSAGKDRTGIMSALILNMFGANQKDIVKDYLLINRSNRLKIVLAPIVIFFTTWSFKKAYKVLALYKVKKIYSSGGFNTPPLWGETRVIKSDCNTL